MLFHFIETMACSLNTLYKLSTFDGYIFKGRGDCRYTLVHDCGGAGNFEVQMEQEEIRANGRTATRGITLLIYVDCVEIKIAHTGVVFVQEERVPLPYAHSSPRNMKITRVGTDIRVVTNKGLFVTWSPTSGVLVRLTTNYIGSACGLCGNANGISEDDSMTRQLIKSTTTRALLHSWKVDDYK